MGWPDTLELTIDGIAQGGEGVGRWRDRVVFAAGGLPGERVRVEIVDQHLTFARAVVTAVLDASPDRTADEPLDHMPWAHISYAAQLRYRGQILTDQLERIGRIPEPPVAPTRAASTPLGYRNAARLHFDGEALGYHEAGTRDVVRIAHDPLVLPVLDATRTAFGSALATFAPGELPTFDVILRASETHGYTLAALRGRELGQNPAIGLLMARWRAAAPQLAGITLDDRVAGAGTLSETFEGVDFVLRPTTFFQANLAAAQVLYDLAREGLALQGGEQLLDLYCGAGAFTLPLARTARVVGIEEYAPAVEDGELTAEINLITGAEFVLGRVEDTLREQRGRVDAALLDPPRRGCHPRALAVLLRQRPERIVYISCMPATLARDLRILIDGGYDLVRSVPVDCFPQTPHVESVSTLVRHM